LTRAVDVGVKKKTQRMGNHLKFATLIHDVA